MATVYYPYGTCSPSGTLPQKNCSPCTPREYARVRAMAFYKKSSPFTDMSSPTEWNTKLLAGNAIVLYGVTGSYAGGDAEELAGFGENETEYGSTTHEITWKDPNVYEDNDFYNALKLTSEWVPVMKTANYIWDCHNTSSIKVKPVISDNLKDVVHYEATAKYTDDDLPTPYAVPAGIFSQCYIVAP